LHPASLVDRDHFVRNRRASVCANAKWTYNKILSDCSACRLYYVRGRIYGRN